MCCELRCATALVLTALVVTVIAQSDGVSATLGEATCGAERLPAGREGSAPVEKPNAMQLYSPAPLNVSTCETEQCFVEKLSNGQTIFRAVTANNAVELRKYLHFCESKRRVYFLTSFSSRHPADRSERSNAVCHAR